jgi:hypothetical protein
VARSEAAGSDFGRITEIGAKELMTAASDR